MQSVDWSPITKLPHRAPRPIKNCIFCGAPNVTNEHVFSRWTHKYLAPRKPGRARSSIGQQYPDRERTPVIVKLPGQMRDWQVKCVCGGTHTTCNGGWMKDIEDAAKPILTPLIVGEEKRISPEEQQVIATWAVLKSILSEYGDFSPRTVHHKHRQYLMVHALPPKRGWGVWIGSFYRRDWIPELISRQALLLPEHVAARRESKEATHFNSNATTQVVGRIFIHVLHSPMPNLATKWRFHLPDGGTLFRIWPRSNTSIKWPSRALTDRDADAAADAFSAFILEAQRKRLAVRNANAAVPP